MSLSCLALPSSPPEVRLGPSLETLSLFPYPRPARYCHPASTATESSKGHAIILSSQLLQDDGGHGKTSKFHVYKPIAVLVLL